MPEYIIHDLLANLGCPCGQIGYYFLTSAIAYTLDNYDRISTLSITKELYPEVAKMHNSTAPRAERNIRKSIEEMFEHGNIDMLTEVFGGVCSPTSGKVRNSDFIKRCAVYLHDRYDGDTL